MAHVYPTYTQKNHHYMTCILCEKQLDGSNNHNGVQHHICWNTYCDRVKIGICTRCGVDRIFDDQSCEKCMQNGLGFENYPGPQK